MEGLAQQLAYVNGEGQSIKHFYGKEVDSVKKRKKTKKRLKRRSCIK